MHEDWPAFLEATRARRRVALTTRATTRLWDFRFTAGDVLVLGPETTGLCDRELAAMHAQVRIPMRADAPVRSLNLSTAAGIAAMEALRRIAPEALR